MTLQIYDAVESMPGGSLSIFGEMTRVRIDYDVLSVHVYYGSTETEFTIQNP